VAHTRILATDRARIGRSRTGGCAGGRRRLPAAPPADASGPEQKQQDLDALRRQLAVSQQAIAAIGRMTDALTTSPDLQHLLSALLGVAVDSLGLTAGAILTFGPTRQNACVRALIASNSDDRLPALESLVEGRGWLGKSLAAEVAALGFPVVARYHGSHPSTPRSVLGPCGVRVVLALPLSRGDDVLGVVELGTETDRSFSRSEAKLAQAMAGYAAVAIENAALCDELQGKGQQVSSLVQAIVDAQEAEREQIALEIHDGLSQTLAAACHYHQLTEQRSKLEDAELRGLIRKTGTLIQRALQEAREIISDQCPAVLDREGLVAALRADLDALRAQTGWDVRFEADWVRLPRAVEKALYRIVQEALNNARRHSQTRRLDVRLQQKGRVMAVEVRDYGVGFDLSRLSPGGRGNHVGLRSMRRRAELLQGRCEIHSAPGLGTAVRVEVPRDQGGLPAAKDDGADQAASAGSWAEAPAEPLWRLSYARGDADETGKG